VKLLLNFIKTEKLFIVILLSFHAIYFIYAITLGNIYTNDSEEYLQSAYNLKTYGEVYSYLIVPERTPEYYSLRPPLYGIFILTIKYIFNSDFFVILVQNILNIFICILLLFLFKGFDYKIKIKYTILLTLLFCPTQLIIVNSIGADLLLELLLILSFTFLVYFFRFNNIKFIILYNLMLVLAVLTKPIMVYFWIPNLIFSLYLFSTRRNLVILLSALLLPLSVYTWCVRNENQTGYFHFSSIKTQNILDLNAGAVLTMLKGENEASTNKKDILSKADQKPTYALKSEFIVSESMKIIKHHPLTYAYTHVKGMLNFMFSIGRYDMVIFCPEMFREEISIAREIETKGLSGIAYYFSNISIDMIVFMLLILLWNTVLLASTLAFCFTTSIHPGIRIFILIMISYICFVCGSGGQARFKISVLPLMMITVPFFIEFLNQIWFSSNRRQVSIRQGLCLLILLFI
jgi:hypothetical protein